jgi:regulator of nonsense transcripts 2
VEVEPGTLSADVAATNGAFPELFNETDELVEKETRDRFKKMCEGYFENVSKKLVIEHKVWRECLPRVVV